MSSRAFITAVNRAQRDRLPSRKDLSSSSSTRTYARNSNGEHFSGKSLVRTENSRPESPLIGAWRPQARNGTMGSGYLSHGYSLRGKENWCSEERQTGLKASFCASGERSGAFRTSHAGVDFVPKASSGGLVAARRGGSRDDSSSYSGYVTRRRDEKTDAKKTSSVAASERQQAEERARPTQQGNRSSRVTSPQPQPRRSAPPTPQQHCTQPEIQQRSQGRTFDGPQVRGPSQPGRGAGICHPREQDVFPQRRPTPAAPSVGRPQRSSGPAASRDPGSPRCRTESQHSDTTRAHHTAGRHPRSTALAPEPAVQGSTFGPSSSRSIAQDRHPSITTRQPSPALHLRRSAWDTESAPQGSTSDPSPLAWDTESAPQGSTSDPSPLAWDTESAAQGSTAAQRAGPSTTQDRCPRTPTRQPSPAPQFCMGNGVGCSGQHTAHSSGRSTAQDRRTTRQPSPARHLRSSARGMESAAQGGSWRSIAQGRQSRQPSTLPQQQQQQQQQPTFGTASAAGAPQTVIDSADSEASLRRWASQHSERSQQEWQELAWQLCRAELEGDTCWAEEDVEAEHEAPYTSLFERLEAAYC